MKLLQSIPAGPPFALTGTKDELRAISARLVKLLADMDAHDAAAAERAGERGIDPTHSVTLGLPEVDALEEIR